MSNWTHVAGIIRFDSFRDSYLRDGVKNTDYTLEDMYNVIGKKIDSAKDWNEYDKNPQDYLPAGSEGSLQLSMWTNPYEYCVSSYTVSIFGDLRDHHCPQYIIEWFKNKLTEIENDENNNLFIRQATITANNEKNGTINWTADY